VRTVHLREIGSRWGGRSDMAGPESVALDVPGADPSSQGLLEVTFDPGGRLGDWDFQLLGTAANLGALVLEIERSRLQLARAGLLNPNRQRRDGAAPLIGSTDVMRALRSAIERACERRDQLCDGLAAIALPWDVLGHGDRGTKADAIAHGAFAFRNIGTFRDFDRHLRSPAE